MGGIEGWARIVLRWVLGMPLHSSSFNTNRSTSTAAPYLRGTGGTTARPHPGRCGGVPKEGLRLCLLRWTLRFRLVRKMQIFGL